MTNKKGLAGVVGTIAAGLLLVFVPKEEGTELRAYKDVASVWTICSGDTKGVKPGMVETKAGCEKRLEDQLIAHAAPVLACTPWLRGDDRDYPRAAAVSLAYNIGVSAYCSSTVAKRFNAGDQRGACDAFLMWDKARVNGKLVVVKGLHGRRERERKLCLKKT